MSDQLRSHMSNTTAHRVWRQRNRSLQVSSRIHRYAYIPEARLQVDASYPIERRLASQVFERPVPTVPTDPFEQLATDSGLRVSVDRLSLAPRDLVAPPDEAERCYLVTLAGPEGGTAARLVYVTSLLESRVPGLRDVLWWLASDAWAVERSGGDVAKWAATRRLTNATSLAAVEFDHYRAQAGLLAETLGEKTYRRLLAAYEAEVRRASSAVESIAEPRGRHEQRP